MKKALILGVIANLAMGITANAQMTGSTNATVKEQEPSLLKNFSMSLLSIYNGSAIATPFSSLQPDTYGVQKNADGTPTKGPVNLENYLSLSQKLADGITLGAVVPFIIVPVREGDNSIGNPYARLANGKLISQGNFNLAADLRLGVPMSNAAQKDNLLTYFRSKQTTTYAIPNTRWTPGLISSARYWMYRDATIADGKGGTVNKTIWDFAAIPNIDYQISPSTSANIAYEMDGIVNAGTGWASDGTSLSAGVSWDATGWLNINPSLEFATSTNRVTANTTVGKLALTFKLL